MQDRESALALAESVKALLASFGASMQVDAKRYWKIPEWFEVSVVLAPVADAAATFKGVLQALGEGWQSRQSSSDELTAVWNHEAGSFFDPAVRFANRFALSNPLGVEWREYARTGGSYKLRMMSDELSAV